MLWARWSVGNEHSNIYIVYVVYFFSVEKNYISKLAIKSLAFTTVQNHYVTVFVSFSIYVQYMYFLYCPRILFYLVTRGTIIKLRRCVAPMDYIFSTALSRYCGEVPRRCVVGV
jgi:hypothetical protein